jgi:uracil-DNA glycosylase family protein
MVSRSSQPTLPFEADKTSPAEPGEAIKSLGQAAEAVQECTRCDLYKHATQAVFGEGPALAHMMFVGEQPGDQEDLAGRPFVGPAGKVFDQALAAAGIDRGTIYVTNAVKHFKFQPRGKKRLHQRPNGGEIRACRFWLDLERKFVNPLLTVAMGATAVQSLLGSSATITSLRGAPLQLDDGSWLMVTIHPSYLLRMADRGDVAAEREKFEDDLRAAKAFERKLASAA